MSDKPIRPPQTGGRTDESGGPGEDEAAPQLVLACCPDLARLGERVALCGSALIIGRSETLPLFPGGPLPGDKMSRRHASVVPAELADAPTVRGGAATAPAMPLVRGRSLIEDLGSTNGTFLNGEKVDLLTSLSHGDVIRAGLMLLVYVEEPVPESQKPFPAGRSGEELVSFYRKSKGAARLSERKSDIPVLFYHFLHQQLDARPLLSVSGMELLMLHPWPGNIDEMKSIVDLQVATRLADMEVLALTREVVSRLAKAAPPAAD